MGPSGGTSAGNITKLVNMESVVSGREAFNEDCDVGGICARGLVKSDVAANARIGDS